MQYPISINGFESQNIVVESAGMMSGPKLLVNGQPASAGPKRGQFSLRRDDGSEVVASWKAGLGTMGGVPQLVVGDEVITVTEPLKWYEIVWSALPMALIILGGLIGGLVGAAAFAANSRIFQSEQSGAMKFIITGGITAVAFVVYLIVSSLVLSLF
ncbi:MAG: hypothetical protein AAF490_23260 [Chloroflexota bacterium]